MPIDYSRPGRDPIQTTNKVKLSFLLPSMTAVSNNPMKVLGTFLALSLASAVLAPDLWNSLEIVRVFALSTTTTVLAGASAVGVLNRLPRKPREPKRRTAKPRSAGRMPSPTMPLLINRCLICNRPLRDPTSMRAGVGPDCRAKYGARPQHQPNPAHATWQRRVEEYRSEAAVQQREYDAEYARARTEHARQLNEWQAALATPTHQARARARRVATRTVGVDVGVIAGILASDALARVVVAAGVPSLF